MTYRILVMGSTDNEALTQQLGDGYDAVPVTTFDEARSVTQAGDIKVALIIERGMSTDEALACVSTLKDDAGMAVIPVVVMANSEHTLAERMAFFDAGVDDLVQSEAESELQARMMRVIFNKVANDQLKIQLDKANEMAFIAMSDTSDLGVNIQFLLDINKCNNLDEAGMRLFQALKSYNINCSLQMRSRFGTKNMEVNGMAKDLESALMEECKDQGRYVDFGRRSIMNYENVSLLVKNMPLGDDKKYGAIKDNVFSLLQGLDARVTALDDIESLKLESQLVCRLTASMTDLMDRVDRGYHEVMTRIADVVEDIADGVDREIQFLGMDEDQERAMQKIMENGITSANRVFNDGLRMDTDLKNVLGELGRVVSQDHVDAGALLRLVDHLPTVSQPH